MYISGYSNNPLVNDIGLLHKIPWGLWAEDIHLLIVVMDEPVKSHAMLKGEIKINFLCNVALQIQTHMVPQLPVQQDT